MHAARTSGRAVAVGNSGTVELDVAEEAVVEALELEVVFGPEGARAA
jgi:hypothetical protein